MNGMTKHRVAKKFSQKENGSDWPVLTRILNLNLVVENPYEMSWYLNWVLKMKAEFLGNILQLS